MLIGDTCPKSGYSCIDTFSNNYKTFKKWCSRCEMCDKCINVLLKYDNFPSYKITYYICINNTECLKSTHINPIKFYLFTYMTEHYNNLCNINVQAYIKLYYDKGIICSHVDRYTETLIYETNKDVYIDRLLKIYSDNVVI